MAVSSLVAASGGPTLTEISGVTPFPTWVPIANGTNFNGVTSTTISGLSAYKAIRIYYSYTVPSAASSAFMRFNSDSNSNYHTVFLQYVNNNYPKGDHRAFESSIQLGYGNAGTRFAGFIEISNNQSTSGPKYIRGKVFMPSSSELRDYEGFYGSNSQISTMTLSNDAGNFSGSILYVVGAV